jgi:hypothetical protein
VLVLALSAAVSGTSPPLAAGLPGAVTVFLTAAWVALSLAQVSRAARSAQVSSGRIRLNRYWLLAVAGVVGAIFAVGLTIAGWLTPQTIAALLAALSPVWTLVGSGVLGLFTAVGYVVFFLLTPLLWLLHRLAGRGTPYSFEPPAPFTDLLTLSNSNATALPPTVLWVLRGAFAAGLLVLVGLLFAWALRWFQVRDEEGVKESRELIWSLNLIRTQLASLLRRHAKSQPLFAALPNRPEDPRLVVRAAYRRLLEMGLQLGQPRQPGQTPADYLATLVSLWPQEAEALRTITEAYTAARYSAEAPTPEQAAEIRLCVSQVTATFRHSRRSIKGAG